MFVLLPKARLNSGKYSYNVITPAHAITIWGCIQKFPDWADNEVRVYNNKHSLRSNTKGYGGKTQ
jgi:hypothetical protein